MTLTPPPVAVEPPAAASAVPSRIDNQRRGILLILVVSFIFAVQDAIGRHLASQYPAIMVVMLRYWFFALFAIWLMRKDPSGLKGALKTRHKGMQITRGILLAGNVIVMLIAFVKMGIVESHAVFAIGPLMVVALSGPMLGEQVGWRRWAAIAVGFAGMLIILQPGVKVFSPWALLPLMGASMFAVYAILTRQVSAEDSSIVSFFWAGVTGAIGSTLAGIWYLQPLALADWPWMFALCLTGATAHYLLIRAYEIAEASSLQPFAYTQLVWVSLIGVFILGETVGLNVIIGMIIIVAAGLFTWWRAMQKARSERRA